MGGRELIRSLIIGIRIRGSKSLVLLMSLLRLLTSWIGTAHHHTAGTVSDSSVSSLGCVGDGRCVSAVYTLALPIAVLLEYRGIVNIDGFVIYNVRVCRACFLFWKFR